MRARAGWLAAFLAAAGTGLWLARPAPPGWPPGLGGLLVYVSDASGEDALYCRRLPDGEDRRLTHFVEPVSDPSLSPDGRQVAFAMEGRIAVVSLDSPRVRFLTVGVDWMDSAPAWRSDAKALVVASRRPGALFSDVHLLTPTGDGDEVTRTPLTETPGLDEQSPVFVSGDRALIFVREDSLYRLELKDARPRRIAGGFRKYRAPCVLPSGRVLVLWNEGKLYGIDALDPDGRNRETLSEGTICYRNLAPSPDGRFLAATFSFDLAFHPREALRLRQREEVRLLDARGRALAPLLASWRTTFHSPAWSR